MALCQGISSTVHQGDHHDFSPIQFTGGQGAELYKGAGNASDIISYRDVHISTAPGTNFAGVIKCPFMQRLKDHVVDTQYGVGLNAGGSDFIHFAARASLDVAEARNMSCALVFADIQTAFASLQRFLVLPLPSSLASFQAFLKTSGFSLAFIENWIGKIEEFLPWSRIPESDALLDLIAALHEYSWMSTEGLDGVMHLGRGSLAGNLLGDIIFSAGMIVLIKKMKRMINELGINADIDPAIIDEFAAPFTSLVKTEPVPFPYVSDISYVDDLMLPIIQKADSLCEVLPRVLSIVHQVYTQCAFIVNWKPKKTSLMIVFHGEGSREVAKEFFKKNKNKVCFKTFANEDMAAPIVKQYRHMGGIMRTTKTMMPELKSRYTSLHSLVKPLERRVFANHFIPIEKKLYTVPTILYIRMLFNAGTWPSLNILEGRYLHGRIMNINRHVTQANSKSTNDNLSDLEILIMLFVAPPQVILRVMRLRLMYRVAQNALPYIMAVLLSAATAKASWIKAVENDLLYFVSRLAELEISKVFLIGQPIFGAAIAAFKARPALWKRKVNSLFMVEQLRTTEDCMVTPNQMTIRDIIQCPECQQYFYDQQKMLSHRAKEHGYRNDTRKYINSIVCKACLCQYHSYHNLEAHLLKVRKTPGGKQCWIVYNNYFPELDEHEREEADEVFRKEYKATSAAGESPTFVSDQVYKLAGPLHRPIIGPVLEPNIQQNM